MKQDFNTYTFSDFEVWKTLFERQEKNLSHKACDEYLMALEHMKPVLHANRIPEFDQMNEWFKQETGWQIQCVPGLIPVDQFFCLLAEKKFPSSTWLRNMDQLDYLEEPDMFHDVFGHVPLLSNSVFSSFMTEFGSLGKLCLNDPERLIMLQRLYWFTIEFGLIEKDSMKIYGAGIASSFGESNSSLQDGPEHIPFDLDVILNTPFKNDEVQNRYFVIESFEQLFEALQNLKKNWKIPVYAYK